MRTPLRLCASSIAMLLVFAFCAPASAGLDEILTRQPSGPAFDCKAPKKTTVETLICTTPQLGKLDLDLSDAYADVALGSDDVEAAVADEGAWLATRDRCAGAACLARAYRARIAVLKAERKNRDASRRAEHGALWAPFAASPRLVADLAHAVGVKPACLTVDGRIDPGDGSASLMGHICGPCPVPRGSVAFVIFHRENGSYRRVLQAAECYVTGLFSGFQTARTHGLYRIATDSRISCCDHQRDFYDYDGRVYRHSATIDDHDVGADFSHTEITLSRDPK